MCLFNDQLQLLISLNKEIHRMLEVEEESNEWIDMMDKQIVKFKKRVQFWLKIAEEDRSCLQSNKSHSSRESSIMTRSGKKSNTSMRSSCSNKPDTSKPKSVEG